jgi:hypothetical protein
MLSSGVFRLQLTFQSFFEKEIVLAEIRDGTGLVDLTFESLHGVI